MSERFLITPRGRMINVRFIVEVPIEGTETEATITLRVIGDQELIRYRTFKSPARRDALKQAETERLQLKYELERDNSDG